MFDDATKTGLSILFAIEVLKEYRKNGIAQKLMNRFENDAMKKRIDAVMIFYNNKDGIETFYEKLNYEIGKYLNAACKALM